jgi:hypothetical protein
MSAPLVGISSATITSKMPKHVYGEIGARDFRLFLLSPGVETDPLQGELKICEIDTYLNSTDSDVEEDAGDNSDEIKPANGEEIYDAISYVWGSNDRTKSVSTSSGTISLTDSLYSCLQRVRLPDKARIIWADAICVNLENKAEKESQVLLMRHIYGCAKKVLAYLGEEEHESSQAMDLAERYWRYYLPAPENADAKQLVEDLLQEEISDVKGKAIALPPDGDPKWLSVARLLNRPWFRRVWIVQEFILAKDVIMICGPKTIRWSQLWPATIALDSPEVPPWPVVDMEGNPIDGAASLMPNLPQRLRFYQLGAMRGTYLKRLNDNHSHADSEAAARAEEDEWEDEKSDDDEEEEEKGESEEESDDEDAEWGTDLLDLLMTFRDVEASDPRDYYYGLLGVATDGEKAEFRPNYSESFETTALRFGKALMDKPLSEELLDHSGLAISDQFPSWLPDFRKPWRQLTVADAAEAEACGDSDFDYGFEIGSNDVLLLKGYRFDTVDKISNLPRAAHLHENPHQSIHEDLRSLRKLLQLQGDCRKYPTGEPRLDAVLRSLTFFQPEHDEDEGEIPAAALRLPYWFSTVTDESEEGQDKIEREELKNEFLATCMIRTPDRAKQELEMNTNIFLNHVLHTRQALDLVLCSTIRSYVGMVPEATRSGDEIWVLKGCSAPFVLRKSSEKPERYQIVGTTYIHGIMNGEVLEEDGFEFTPITIY